MRDLMVAGGPDGNRRGAGSGVDVGADMKKASASLSLIIGLLNIGLAVVLWSIGESLSVAIFGMTVAIWIGLND